MLKEATKSMIKWFIKKINLPHLIAQVQHQRKIDSFNRLAVNNGATFYPESEVVNLSNDRSRIVIGKNTHIRGELFLYQYAKRLQIGSNCFIGKGTIIRAGDEITIGDNVLIAHNVTIFDTDSHEMNHIERSESYKKLLISGHPAEKGRVAVAPIHIEDHVWISYNCCILKGVSLGKGAIIAAGSVVTKNVAPFTLVAGNPAKLVKTLL
jgi:acetyltransferase-like isoleucine patch superfamily enzyme